MPSPIAWEWLSDGMRLLVEFDVPLVEQELADSNWRVMSSVEPTGIRAIAAQIVGGEPRVQLTFEVDASVGAQSVNYAAEPPDVVANAANGVAAPPFVFEIRP